MPDTVTQMRHLPPRSSTTSCSEDAMGGVEKSGGWKTSRMTPLPKRGFGPPSYGTFSTPLRCQCSVFLYKNPRQSRPEALLEGSKNFRESAFSGTFSSPHTFCTPPYHGPSCARQSCCYIVGTSRRGDMLSHCTVIPVARQLSLPLVCLPLFKRAQSSGYF